MIPAAIQALLPQHPGEENPVPEQEYRIDALGIVMVE